MQTEQLTMFADAPAVDVAPPIWERIASPIGRLFTTYLHRPSGYVVRHCGHPTANFPYYIETPEGANIYAPNGRGFQRLDLAKQHVENHHSTGGSYRQNQGAELMKTIYTQRSREDGKQTWREGSDASERFIAIDNIMETIAQKHKPSDAAWSVCFTDLMQSGRCAIDGTTYEITEREEEEEEE